MNETNGHVGLNLEAVMEHWIHQLSGKLPVSMLPLISNGEEATGDTQQSSQQIPEHIGKKCREICRQSDTDIYMFWLSAINAVLYRYTAKSDFMTGTPFLNIQNKAPSYEDNLIFIMGNLSGDLPFRKLQHRVRRGVEEILKYQDFPFETVYDMLKLKTGVSQPDIFHIAFIYEKIQTKNPLIDKFDLSIHLSETNDRLTVQYNSGIYAKDTISYFIDNLLVFVENVLEDMDIPLDHTRILSDRECKRLYQFNDTGSQFPENQLFIEMFQQQVIQTPHRIAAVCGDRQLTYLQLNLKANRLAHMLKSKGIGRDKTVALLFERSIPLLTAMLAVLKAGGAFVPIDIRYPRERMTTVLAHSGTTVLMTDCYTLKEIDIADPRFFLNTKIFNMICLDVVNKKKKSFSTLPLELCDKSDIVQYPTSDPPPVNQPHDMAYIIFNSSTTGTPKGVIVEHIGLSNHLDAKIKNLDIQQDSIVSQNASHCLDISVWQFLAALVKGGKTVIFPNHIVFHPQRFIREATLRETTVLEVVPTYLSKILDFLESTEPTQRNAFKRHYLSASDDADKFDLTARWFQLSPGLSIINAYSPEESPEDISHQFLKTMPDKTHIPTGKILQNYQIYIVNEALKLCPVGVTGEICVSGIGIGRGFLNDPELTDLKFLTVEDNKTCLSRDGAPEHEGAGHQETSSVKKIYRTGDLGRFLPDGTVEFMGRKDLQVRIRGFRIELSEIENRLEQHPGIKEAVVVDREDVMGNKLLCAYFIPVEEPDITEFKIYLAEGFPEYMVPDYFIRMNRFPRLPNGDVNRQELPSPGRDLRYLEAAANPADEIETKLLEMWIGVLGKENISLDDNFFDVGGTSLNGMEIIHMVRKRLKVEIPLQELFRASTIRALSSYIREHRPKQQPSDDIIPRVKKSHFYPLSFGQERLVELSTNANVGTSFNMPAFFYIQGVLDYRQFSHALNDLVQRQKVLRTYFQTDETTGQTVQCILPHLEYRVDYREADELEFKPLMYKFVQPFQLDKPPLFRIKLIKMKTRSLLMMDFHRAIFDELSLRIFIQDFIALYNGDMRSTLRIRYHDFAVWQKHRLSSDKMDLLEQYWLVQFRGMLPDLNLPLDFPRPPVMTFKGAHVKTHLGTQLTEKLRILAREHHATLHMTLLAIYNLLLAAYSGQSDITVATLEGGRHMPELRGLVGMFANILAMRNFPSHDKSFAQFLAQVKRNLIEAYENRNYPFERLVNALQLSWSGERNPLTDTMLMMENTAEMTFYGDTFTLTPIEHRRRHTIFDITLYCRDTGKEFQFSWLYKTALFKRETIQQMATSFTDLISAVVKNPETTIKELSSDNL